MTAIRYNYRQTDRQVRVCFFGVYTVYRKALRAALLRGSSVPSCVLYLEYQNPAL